MPGFERSAAADGNRLRGLSVAIGGCRGWEADGWRAVVEVASAAEEWGFHSIWLTGCELAAAEVLPNLAIFAAAVAVNTQQIKLRVELTEHPRRDPLRAAEDWSVVDNLSSERVEMLCAAPPGDSGAARARILSIRDLWSGTHARRTGPGEEEYSVRVYPAPRQAAPKFWLADVGDRTTPRLSAELNTGTYLTRELSLARIESRVALLHERFQEVHGRPGRVAVAVGTALNRDEIERIHELGVEEIVHVFDMESSRDGLGQAVAELARQGVK